MENVNEAVMEERKKEGEGQGRNKEFYLYGLPYQCHTVQWNARNDGRKVDMNSGKN